MVYTKKLISDYVTARGCFPATLEKLSAIEGFNAFQIQDAWGYPISYKFDERGDVTLLSLGADGVEGGIRENQDYAVKISYKDEGGRWRSEPVWVERSRLAPYD